MNWQDGLQLALFFTALLVLVRPLGAYMARVYQRQPVWPEAVLGPLERWIYRIAGVRADVEMNWKDYAVALLAFNVLGALWVYALQRLQAVLPLNPQGVGAVAPDLAFNTAVSFASNTNWQSYSGESTLSYLTQMLGLTGQNFLSAAAGMAVLAALGRSFARQRQKTIGNFWVDVTRGTLYILLPLSLVLAVALASQGVVQTFAPARPVETLQGGTQTLMLGPVASQVAIKQLGTNGGGFFGANSAHPYENPTPLSNGLEMLAIVLIPAALCYTFGQMVGDRRQGWAILVSMLVLFAGLLAATLWSEQQVAGFYSSAGVDGTATALQPGGNLEGKEVRFGVLNSALWTALTTAASNGSVNAMHDSYNPLGGLAAMWAMQLGEVVFGGVGSGLYGMLVFVLVAVFVAGLMVGRTPEYLGKKIGPFEMKMAALVILLPPVTVLIGTALAVVSPAGVGAISNPGPHGFSQVLYAFSSAANNNGSAFAGLGSNNLFYNLALGVAMWVGRYWLAVLVLAIAGALVQKKHTPPGAGTLATHTPLFVGWLLAVVVVVGALSFLPALALGPLVEHLLVFQVLP